MPVTILNDLAVRGAARLANASGGAHPAPPASGYAQAHSLSGRLYGQDVSGTVYPIGLTSGAVLSGSIASGQVGANHLASGAVVSGRVASGQVGRYHLSSGATPTATYGQTVAAFAGGSSYRVLSGGANGTWAHSDGTSTLPSVDLPEAGSYYVTGYGRGNINANSGQNASISVRLYNSTSGVVFSGSEGTVLLTNDGLRTDVNALLAHVCEVLGPTTVQMQAMRNNATNWAQGNLSSDDQGRVKLLFFKIGP